MSRGIRVPLGVMCVVLWMSASGPAASAQQPTAVIQIVVRSDAGPVHKAQVIIGGKTTETDASGQLTLEVPPGPVEVTVVKEGYNPVTVSATATLGPPQEIPIVLERQTAIEEHVTVSATRTDKRFEDQPMRVELLDAEEIVEKQLMTPGDIVMMLNEMGGLRVQATSPSLGAASVRVQGMRGRYTRFLSDAAVRDRRRRSRPTADSADRPGPGRSHQRRCVRAVRGWRARRRRRSDFATAHEGTDPRSGRQPNQPRRHRCDAVCRAAILGALEWNDARWRALAGACSGG
jgi:hypothetical protein